MGTSPSLFQNLSNPDDDGIHVPFPSLPSFSKPLSS